MWQDFAQWLATLIAGICVTFRLGDQNQSFPTDSTGAAPIQQLNISPWPFAPSANQNAYFGPPADHSQPGYPAGMGQNNLNHPSSIVTSNRTLVDLSSVLASLQQLLIQQNQRTLSSTPLPYTGNNQISTGEATALSSVVNPAFYASGRTSSSAAGYDYGTSSAGPSVGQPFGYTVNYASGTQSGPATHQSRPIGGTYTAQGKVSSPSSTSSGSQSIEFRSPREKEVNMIMGAPNMEGSPIHVAAAYTGGTPRLTVNQRNISGMARSGRDGRGQTTLQGGCGIPNNLRGVMLDPLKMAGDWNELMYYTPGHFRPSFNVRHKYVSLGYTLLQDGTTWALATTSQVSQYVDLGVSGNGLQCIGIFEQSNLTANGQRVAITYLPGQAPSNFISVVLYADYQTVELIYRCNKPNALTGLCDVPYFWVNIRADPRNLTQAARAAIMAAVDATLGPYCFPAKDFTFTQWITAPPCDPSNSMPDGFRGFVAGMQAHLFSKPKP